MDYGTYDPATAQDMLTDVVPSQPRSVLPMTRRARLLQLQQRAAEMEGAEPDVSQLQQFAAAQGKSGDAAMLNALAAQYAGEQFQPVQAQFLKRAMAAQEPMKVGGGMLTPDGKFIRDPFAAQDRGLSRLDRLIQSEQGAITAEEAAAQRRADAEQRRQDLIERERQRREDAQARLLSDERYRRDMLDLRRTVAGRGDAPPKPRALPWNSIKEFSTQAGLADAMTDLVDTFKPDFAGGPVLGNVQNALGRAGVGYADQSNWWQRYQEQSNLIRNELFGSALTATEKAAFDAANITPGMGAKQIETRLRQQAEAAQRAYNRLKEAAAGSGFDVKGLPDVRSFRNPTPALPQGQPDGLSPEEQAELERLRAKHRRNQ